MILLESRNEEVEKQNMTINIKEKVSQKIAKELITMIQQGKFSSGSKLPSETDLAKTFGVSRASIREALSVLKAMGIISSQQGGGSYVEEVDLRSFFQEMKIQPADKEQMKYLFEIRFVLETQAAYFAAQRRNQQDLENLEKALAKFSETMEKDEESGVDADIEFHRAMIQATHNPVMVHIMEDLSELYHKVLNITLSQNIGKRRKRRQVYREHEAIFHAIQDGEPELAKVQCAIHLQNVQKKFLLDL